MAAGFYVYEHTRRDTGAVFYVGKGKGDRATTHRSRNRHWRNIVSRHGFDARIVFRTVHEELAFLAEEELIAKHRRAGVPLVNLTDGGEGVSGLHRKQSQEEIEHRRIANTGQRRTPEQRARIAAAKRGHGVGRRLSDATKRKMSETRKGRSISQDRLKGRRRPPHVVAALKAANEKRFSARRARLLRAIDENPGATIIALSRVSGCNRETVSKYVRERRASAGDR